MLLRFIRFPGILVAVALIIGVAPAQDARQIQLNGWNATLNQIDATLQRADLDAATLAQLKGAVEAVLAGADALKRQLQPQIADAEAQQQSLGPPPAPPATEAAVIVAQRERLRAILTSLTGIVEQADVLAVRASQLLATIGDRFSQQFTSALFAHGPSILSALMWVRAAMEVPGVPRARRRPDRRMVRADRRPFRRPYRAAHHRIAPGRRRDPGVPAPLPQMDNQERGRQHRAVRGRAHPGGDLGSDPRGRCAVPHPGRPAGGLQRARNPARRIAILYDGLTQAVLVFTVLTGLARALFAPGRPTWRIARLSDRTTVGLFRLIVIAAVLLALLPLIGALADVTVASADLTAVLGGGIALTVAILVVAGGSLIARDRPPAGGETAEPGWRWRWLAPIASIAAVAAVVADIAGYLALARFLVEQIAWVATVLGMLVLALGLVRQAVTTLFSSERAIGTAVTRNVGLGPSASSQASVLVDGIARLLLFLLAVVLIAAPWGFDSSDLIVELGRPLTASQIGTITITFSTILAAIAVFIAGVIIARMFQTWLDRRFLPTTSMDAGLENSITTSLGYLGIILAALAVASFAGFGLANIAIVAGALSVGIGFGLQSIVNNFVSGLILLAERPIRAGDWIVVGPDEGSGEADQRAGHRDRDLRPRLGDHPQFQPDLGRGQESRTSATTPAGPWSPSASATTPTRTQVKSILLDCRRQQRWRHPRAPCAAGPVHRFRRQLARFRARCFLAEALARARLFAPIFALRSSSGCARRESRFPIRRAT